MKVVTQCGYIGFCKKELLGVDPRFIEKIITAKCLRLFTLTSDSTIYFQMSMDHLITDKMWGIYYKPDI